MDYSVKADLDRDAAGSFESDWTPYLMEGTIIRGRRSELEEQQPSTLELVLKNTDGRFSPDKGTLSGLDHDIRVQVYEGTNGSYRFTGHIVDFDCDPHSLQQVAVIRCVDMLGVSEAITISMGNVLDHTADLSLNRLLDLMEAGEIITNPGAETDVAEYDTLGSTVTRETTTADVLEGDGSVKTVTDNVATEEGYEYNLNDNTSLVAGIYRVGLFIKGDNGATLKIRAYGNGAEYTLTDVDITCTGSWQYVRGSILWSAGMIGAGDESIRVRTTSQQSVTFYTDGLHLAPYANRIDRSLDTGLTTLNRVAFGEERADVALRKVVDSEPGLMWFDGQGQFIFKNRNNLFGNATEDFGYETQGTAGTYNLAADNKLACKQTLTVDAYIESMDIYCGANSGTANVRLIIYSDSSGPDALKITGPETNINDTDEWKTLTLDYPVFLPAGDYWIGLIVDAQVDIPYDAGDAGQTEDLADTYSDGPADPFGAGAAQARECSIHINYRYASAELNWADDGVNKEYQVLKVAHSAKDRIRFVRIKSSGNYEAGTEIVRFWEYEPLPITVLARVPPNANYTRLVFFEAPRGMRILTLTCSGTDANHTAQIGRGGGGVMVIVLRNYTLTNWSITALSVTGKQAIEATEQSIYEHEETSASPYVYRPLETEMPFLGAAEDEPVIRGEAARLGRFVNRVLRAPVGVNPKTDASLTELLALELRDCVTLQNDTEAQSLGIDTECWVEGYEEKFTRSGDLAGVEFVFYVEEA